MEKRLRTGQTEQASGWVPSVCYMCYSCCGIKVRRENGIAVEIAGDPVNPHNQGKLCAKGKAGLMSLYSPYRLTKPVIRTAKAKGIHVDPGWKEVEWEEALNLVAGRLKKIRQDDPRKLILAGMDFQNAAFRYTFASAFGTPNVWMGGTAYFCGKGLHPVLYLTNGAFFVGPDYNYCQYNILFGTQLGFLVYNNAVTFARRMAEARARGMKVVVVDPVGSNAAAKADEWIPIRPGTDAALALGLLNILLNEMEVFDADFLRRRTNAPYLVGKDGYYIRDSGTGKPMVWDIGSGTPKSFDAGFSGREALVGQYEVNGTLGRPAFQLLREHVRAYYPERVARITDVPINTLYRVAEEFGRGASIGSIVSLDGVDLPLRPVCASWNRGAIAHKHAFHTGFAIQLLNIVVGAMDVPGGQIGCYPVGPFWQPAEGPEGLIIPSKMITTGETGYPARKAGKPREYCLAELFPAAGMAEPMFEEAVAHPEKFGLDYFPEMMLNFHSNPLMSTTNPQRMADVLGRISFLVHFSNHLDETAQLADLVLPDAHYLERLVPFPNNNYRIATSGLGPWYWMLQQPVVEPCGNCRSWVEVCLELAYRAGLLDDLHLILNTRLKLISPFRLELGKRYDFGQIADFWSKSWFGETYGLPWLKKNGVLIFREKKLSEAYPGPFLTAKVPIYLEHFVRAKKDLEVVVKELDLDWDTSCHSPLPEWDPCYEFENPDPEYPLHVVNFRWPFHTFSITAGNPWLDELCQWHPWGYKIVLATETAAKLGLADGDPVWISSRYGQGRGVLKISECIHPEVVGIAGNFGHWAKSNSIWLGKGVHFNSLLPGADEAHVDLLSGAMDSCVRVKVWKAL